MVSLADNNITKEEDENIQKYKGPNEHTHILIDKG